MSVDCLIIFLVILKCCYGASAAAVDNTGSTAIGHFAVKEHGHGRTCLLLDLSATFHVQYTKADNSTAIVSYDLPTTSRVTGECPSIGPDSFIHLNFTNCESRGRLFRGNFGLGMTFGRDSLVMKHFHLWEIMSSHTLTPDIFPDAKYANGTAYPYSLGVRLNTSSGVLLPHSYLCKTDFDLYLNQNPGGTVANLTVHYIQVQPFEVRFGKFSEARECSRDHHSTTEPPLTTTVTMYPIENATTVTSTVTTPATVGNYSSIGPASTILPSNHTTIPVITTSMMPPYSSPVYPPVTPGHFIVYNASGEKCLLANMGIRFHINYTKESDMLGTAIFDVPPNAQVSGVCGNSNSTLTLTFYDAMFNLTLSFSRERGDDHVTTYRGTAARLSFVELPAIFPGTLTPNRQQEISNTTLNLFPTNARHSYKCTQVVNVALTKNVSVAFYQVQVQPFDVQSGQFSQAEECVEDSKGGKDEVLIVVVGVVLLVIALGIGVTGRDPSRAQCTEEGANTAGRVEE
ncbi:Lysosome-associated membrane glycoprotein 1 [Branchiostoma belcheri]|nr:Lysosome-associated membrane glycoprotein 1 [Branchiostoma belcheri]